MQSGHLVFFMDVIHRHRTSSQWYIGRRQLLSREKASSHQAHLGGAAVRGAFRNISGSFQLSAQLCLISSGLSRILVFYSGLLWGDDVTGEPGGGAAYICAGRRDCKPGLLEVGISFCSLVAVC